MSTTQVSTTQTSTTDLTINQKIRRYIERQIPNPKDEKGTVYCVAHTKPGSKDYIGYVALRSDLIEAIHEAVQDLYGHPDEEGMNFVGFLADAVQHHIAREYKRDARLKQRAAERVVQEQQWAAEDAQWEAESAARLNAIADPDAEFTKFMQGLGCSGERNDMPVGQAEA